MALFDLPLEALRGYVPPLAEPADFDAFWTSTLDEARSLARPPVITPVATDLRTAEAFDVTFSGFGGQPIKGWLLKPVGVAEPLPVVVEYIGYGGGRGLPTDWLLWSAAGYAHLVMDTRGQGGHWRGGDTPDLGSPSVTESAGHSPGFLTRGVQEPGTYYYRRLVTDAVRAAETAAGLPFADPARILVTGISQGGGLTLAAAGLLGDRVAGAVSGVPFICDLRRAVRITDSDPYAEFARWARANPARAEAALSTMDYVDGVNFARRITAPTLVSVALMDMTCPPSTVFGAYNSIGGRKQIEVYEWDGHEGGRGVFSAASLAFARTVLG
jgi:cephalosporin-C deacetylase